MSELANTNPVARGHAINAGSADILSASTFVATQPAGRMPARPAFDGKLDFSICAQFLSMHLACLLVVWAGVSTVAVVTCLALYIVRMFAITAGFHRLLAHRTYRTSRIFQFLIAFTGTAAYQKGPLWWSAHHRHHHLVADTDQDFHSPLVRRFWRAHFGWFLSRDSQTTHWKLIANLSKYPELRFLDRYYSLPPIVLAAAAFAAGWMLERYAPSLGTSGFQMLVWAFFLSTVVLYHGTFTVNSLAHIFGKRRFPTTDNSRNNLFVALITLGEGWHNNHHHYASSERQGFRWWEIDVSHYTLTVLSWFGIVWDLHAPPPHLVTAETVAATSNLWDEGTLFEVRATGQRFGLRRSVAERRNRLK